jgi:hypothetical protein
MRCGLFKVAGPLTAIFIVAGGCEERSAPSPKAENPLPSPVVQAPATPPASATPVPVVTEQPAPSAMPEPPAITAVQTLFQPGPAEFNIEVLNGLDPQGQKTFFRLGVDADLLGPKGELTAGFLAQLDPHMVSAEQLEALKQKSALAWRQKLKTLEAIESQKMSTDPRLLSSLMAYLEKNHELTASKIEKIRQKAMETLKEKSGSEPAPGPG